MRRTPEFVDCDWPVPSMTSPTRWALIGAQRGDDNAARVSDTAPNELNTIVLSSSGPYFPLTRLPFTTNRPVVFIQSNGRIRERTFHRNLPFSPTHERHRPREMTSTKLIAFLVVVVIALAHGKALTKRSVSREKFISFYLQTSFEN